MSESRLLCGITLPLLLVLGTLLGCSKEDISKLASSAKEAATEGMEAVSDKAREVQETVAEQSEGVSGSVQEQLQLAGSMKLTLGGPLQTDACYVRLVRAGGGRSNVFQLQSYRDKENESFPSVYVHALTSAASLSELAGQSLQAKMFVQTQQGGPIFYSGEDAVQVTLQSIEDDKVLGEFVSGNLIQGDSGASQPVTGSFEGVVRP